MAQATATQARSRGQVALGCLRSSQGGLFLLALVLLFAGLSYLGTTRRLLAAGDSWQPDTVDESKSGRPSRRHLRARSRARPAPPPPAATVTDDPPDAFPAGG